MTEPINFNKVRKDRVRAGEKAQAAQNRVTFGRSKVERVVAKLDALRVERGLDGKKREP